MTLRTLVSIAAVAAGLSLATAASAAVTFVGPEGWRHVEQTTPSDGVHKVDQWKLAGDTPQSVTVFQDSSTSFADSLAAVKKNFADNHIRPAVDKDQPCMGRPSHVVEYSVGPDGHQIIVNRLIVPDGAGVVTITYARGQGDDFDSDVRKALTTFCAQTG
jgi:hypothetical protein